MHLVNPEQLICNGCHEEVFDSREGFIHRDGSSLTDCGDGFPVELWEVA